ncbi:DedA family protein [Pseudonocardiaceae bacterium YIM PH 21723]|nr:DedA family protein [Pseudonocardiaceae bacterium YIM PH 21723]
MAFGPLETAGPWMVWVIVLGFIFVECGLIVGLFLPGDSLLLTAGIVLAQQDHSYHAWGLAIGSVVAAVGGNEFGYYIGRKSGYKLLIRQGGTMLNRQNMDRAKGFLDRYGFWAIAAARWIAWVRTLAPIIAGAVKMDQRRYSVASTVGALTWGPVLLLGGFYGAGLLERYRWLTHIAIAGFVAFVAVGTGYGLYRYRQDMRRPVDEDHDAA